MLGGAAREIGLDAAKYSTAVSDAAVAPVSSSTIAPWGMADKLKSAALSRIPSPEKALKNVGKNLLGEEALSAIAGEPPPPQQQQPLQAYNPAPSVIQPIDPARYGNDFMARLEALRRGRY
jgi:hypothetical protein